MRGVEAAALLDEAADAFYRIVQMLHDERATDAEFLALSMAIKLRPPEIEVERPDALSE